jgi:hypothetical protein
MFYSSDGSRMVQVVGDDKQSYLYDTAATPAFDAKYLDSGVNDVRFKLDDQGALATIMTLTDGGGFDLFDKDGNTQNIQAVPQPLSDGSATASTVGKSLDKSAVLNGLKAGSMSW